MTAPYYAQYMALPNFQHASFVDGKVADNGSGWPRWSGEHEPPQIGERVKVQINSLGAGEVVGYFVEHEWLGLLVRLDDKTRPDWHRKQCGDSPSPSHIFGTEFRPEG